MCCSSDFHQIILTKCFQWCYTDFKLNMGIRLWKLGVNPTQDRCCNSLCFGLYHWKGFWEGAKDCVLYKCRVISQNTYCLPCRVYCAVRTALRTTMAMDAIQTYLFLFENILPFHVYTYVCKLIADVFCMPYPHFSAVGKKKWR